jgi:predicted transcriptional regulator
MMYLTAIERRTERRVIDGMFATFEPVQSQAEKIRVTREIRERQVLGVCEMPLSTTEISKALTLSVYAVRLHVKRLCALGDLNKVQVQEDQTVRYCTRILSRGELQRLVPKHVMTRRKREGKILQFLAAGEELTPAATATMLEVSESTAKKALNNLLEEALIRRIERKSHQGKASHHFVIAEGESQCIP